MRNLFYPYLQRTRPPTTASATAKPLILVISKFFETPDDALTPSVLDTDGADPEADAEGEDGVDPVSVLLQVAIPRETRSFAFLTK